MCITSLFVKVCFCFSVKSNAITLGGSGILSCTPLGVPWCAEVTQSGLWARLERPGGELGEGAWRGRVGGNLGRDRSWRQELLGVNLIRVLAELEELNSFDDNYLLAGGSTIQATFQKCSSKATCKTLL